ncbi:hypothetical protein CBM2634_P90010 [Cupriavidus taiwanensis]|uniref:Uncharacterized protein n=1 Tax=Cupriavidus taiwanensis TaxID=164546 RepID=A0A375JB16_9BURK|nr:hypothetical protein CBM2634_P90010 [Cupriavidus taiwanensis]
MRQYGTVPIDGFIGPAHVSIVIGSQPYEHFTQEYRKPVVIAGFEPLDVMQAVLMLVRQVNEGRAAVENEFTRAVTPHGNLAAQKLVSEVSSDASNATPETAVQFGVANSALTRAIRYLICAGIHKAAFDQRTIRDMREWFFKKKLESTFLVSLDPCLPKWVNNLTRLEHDTLGRLPESVALTAEIASMPGFDWKAEATRILLLRHREAYEAIRKNWLWSFSIAERVESLAKRYQGPFVFDQTALKGC